MAENPNPFGGGDLPFDLNALFAQVQSLFSDYDGPINWPATLDLARKAAAATPDPTPTAGQSSATADALRLADLWIDPTTSFPSGVQTAQAWSKAEWLVNTADVWHGLIEPIAASSVRTVGNQMPEDLKAVAGPFSGFMGKAIGAMIAQQAGQGLGTLAGEVLASSEIGIPLSTPGRAGILTQNLKTFAEGLEGVSEADVLLYVALREAAHQRLFAGVPWLRQHVIDAVTAYAAGVEVNLGAIQRQVEDKLSGMNPMDPAAMQELMGDASLFAIEPSPAQRAAQERLEIVLALVEGWVDEIVTEATRERMPAATALAEAFRRRRAEGGPAEQAFATLVGLELRPRRLRDAATLWGSLRARQGAEARDGVWMSPALLPTAADLDDPLGFREGADALELTDAEFDAGLQALLDGPAKPDTDGTDGADGEQA
ncbi:zinc-dependent metalloprotease [Nocardioides sp.]|uniref:zinc-dependent metalloprotease n=1 Tax=Nocardioides sp. TaxID=35761 RepID=UPI0026291F13|nr:zinc-dependent metalloprotease [Nocardioides sp.]